MRRTSLNELVIQLRGEVRDAPNAAFGINVRDSYENILRRVQETLWTQYDWPFLRVWSDKQLQAGQRYYDPPADMPIERIEKIYQRTGSQWIPVYRGISRTRYNANDSDLGARSDPPTHWDYYNGSANDQIELWPTPASNGNPDTLTGYIRFVGTRRLAPLIQANDRADLDDRMIVLFCAAELLAARGAQDAEIKLRMAQSQFNRLRANAVNNSKTYVMGAGAKDPLVHHSDGGALWEYDANGHPHMVR